MLTSRGSQGHHEINGNVRVDELACKGSETPFQGAEPALGLPYLGLRQEYDYLSANI